MKTSRIKKSITFLFLTLFLSMKMVGLHELSHTNDKDYALHCAICDHAITNNLTPIITSDLQDFEIENIEVAVCKKIATTYQFLASNTIASNQLFSRPPPFLL